METRGKREARENKKRKDGKEKNNAGGIEKKKLKMEKIFEGPKQVWLVGQLVWAKQITYPWWPGLVSDPSELDLERLRLEKPSSSKIKNCAMVYFYGEDTLGWVHVSNLLPFEDPRLPDMAVNFIEQAHSDTKYQQQHPKSFAKFQEALVLAKRELKNKKDTYTTLVDVCWNCKNGGHLLCCDTCPAEYCFTCLNIDHTSVEKIKDWYCARCLAIARFLMKDLLSKLFAMDTEKIFAKPVDVSLYPEYNKYVKQPMDLTTMKRKIRNLDYSSLSDFESDFLLMCKNAQVFNPNGSDVHAQASSLLAFGVKQIRYMKECLRSSYHKLSPWGEIVEAENDGYRSDVISDSVDEDSNSNSDSEEDEQSKMDQESEEACLSLQFLATTAQQEMEFKRKKKRREQNRKAGSKKTKKQKGKDILGQPSSSDRTLKKRKKSLENANPAVRKKRRQQQETALISPLLQYDPEDADGENIVDQGDMKWRHYVPPIPSRSTNETENNNNNNNNRTVNINNNNSNNGGVATADHHYGRAAPEDRRGGSSSLRNSGGTANTTTNSKDKKPSHKDQLHYPQQQHQHLLKQQQQHVQQPPYQQQQQQQQQHPGFLPGATGKSNFPQPVLPLPFTMGNQLPRPPSLRGPTSLPTTLPSPASLTSASSVPPPLIPSPSVGGILPMNNNNNLLPLPSQIQQQQQQQHHHHHQQSQQRAGGSKVVPPPPTANKAEYLNYLRTPRGATAPSHMGLPPAPIPSHPPATSSHRTASSSAHQQQQQPQHHHSSIHGPPPPLLPPTASPSGVGVPPTVQPSKNLPPLQPRLPLNVQQQMLQLQQLQIQQLMALQQQQQKQPLSLQQLQQLIQLQNSLVQQSNLTGQLGQMAGQSTQPIGQQPPPPLPPLQQPPRTPIQPAPTPKLSTPQQQQLLQQQQLAILQQQQQNQQLQHSHHHQQPNQQQHNRREQREQKENEKEKEQQKGVSAPGKKMFALNLTEVPSSGLSLRQQQKVTPTDTKNPPSTSKKGAQIDITVSKTPSLSSSLPAAKPLIMDLHAEDTSSEGSSGSDDDHDEMTHSLSMGKMEELARSQSMMLSSSAPASVLAKSHSLQDLHEKGDGNKLSTSISNEEKVSAYVHSLHREKQEREKDKEKKREEKMRRKSIREEAKMRLNQNKERWRAQVAAMEQQSKTATKDDPDIAALRSKRDRSASPPPASAASISLKKRKKEEGDGNSDHHTNSHPTDQAALLLSLASAASSNLNPSSSSMESSTSMKVSKDSPPSSVVMAKLNLPPTPKPPIPFLHPSLQPITSSQLSGSSSKHPHNADLPSYPPAPKSAHTKTAGPVVIDVESDDIKEDYNHHHTHNNNNSKHPEEPTMNSNKGRGRNPEEPPRNNNNNHHHHNNSNSKTFIPVAAGSHNMKAGQPTDLSQSVLRAQKQLLQQQQQMFGAHQKKPTTTTTTTQQSPTLPVHPAGRNLISPLLPQLPPQTPGLPFLPQTMLTSPPANNPTRTNTTTTTRTLPHVAPKSTPQVLVKPKPALGNDQLQDSLYGALNPGLQLPLDPTAAGVDLPRLFLDPGQMSKLYFYSLTQLKAMKEKNDALEAEVLYYRNQYTLTVLEMKKQYEEQIKNLKQQVIAWQSMALKQSPNLLAKLENGGTIADLVSDQKENGSEEQRETENSKEEEEEEEPEEERKNEKENGDNDNEKDSSSSGNDDEDVTMVAPEKSTKESQPSLEDIEGEEEEKKATPMEIEEKDKQEGDDTKEEEDGDGDGDEDEEGRNSDDSHPEGFIVDDVLLLENRSISSGDDDDDADKDKSSPSEKKKDGKDGEEEEEEEHFEIEEGDTTFDSFEVRDESTKEKDKQEEEEKEEEEEGEAEEEHFEIEDDDEEDPDDPDSNSSSNSGKESTDGAK